MTSRRVLLICGVLSSVLYVGIDQLAAVSHPGSQRAWKEVRP